MAITPGNHPVSTTYSDLFIDESDYILKDNNETYLIDIEGYYLNLGGGTEVGDSTTSTSYSSKALQTASVTAGSHPASSPFTPAP